MNHCWIARITCLFLLISMAGVCIAEEAPGYTLYIQGGESSITEDVGEMMLITIQDVIPYIFSAIGDRNLLLPVRQVSLYSFPMNAALIFPGTMGTQASLVQISNISVSDENKDITFQITPLEFYEGELLKAYAKDAIAIDTLDPEMMKTTSVYMEGPLATPENTDCPQGCGWNGHYCGDFRGWICCPTGPCTAVGNDCVC